MGTEKRLYGLKECSERTSLSRDTLRRLIGSGKLRSVRLCRRVLVPARGN
jgi:excisionase family DNA binding protein